MLERAGVYVVIINVGNTQLTSPAESEIKITDYVQTTDVAANNKKKDDIGRELHYKISKYGFIIKTTLALFLHSFKGNCGLRKRNIKFVKPKN